MGDSPRGVWTEDSGKMLLNGVDDHKRSFGGEKLILRGRVKTILGSPNRGGKKRRNLNSAYSNPSRLS